jgi:hypothetical protein
MNCEWWSSVAFSFLQSQLLTCFSPIPSGPIPDQASLFHGWVVATVGPYASELFYFSFLLCATIRFIFLKYLFGHIILLLETLQWLPIASQIRLLVLPHPPHQNGLLDLCE